MPMDRELVRISKFLSLVLRHRPEEIGIQLDERGWADVEQLIAAANRSGRRLDEATLLRVVAENDKQRFALSGDGRRIRARQGHSLEVDLGLEPHSPPQLLFHGTATRFLRSIRETGLRPGSRQHVHLSPDETTATRVGRRHGSPVVLKVLAGQMHSEGHTFYLSENGVWLVAAVPVAFLIFPEL